MQILKSLCAVPTAPFHENAVVLYIESFVARRKRLRLTRDHSGNLLIELPGRAKKQPRLVFVAHMDHPGLSSRKMIDNKMLDADFRGGVLAEFLPGTPVRFFVPGARTNRPIEISGRVLKVTKTSPRGMAERCNVRVDAPVPVNCPGMFDLTTGRQAKGKFHCRVCDDLAGAASALTMLDRLHRKPPASTVAVLLTRAEEVGFIGALAAVLRPRLLRKSDRIISIETSAEQAYAQQGNGVILRVGDRTSIFNSAFMFFINSVAEELQKRDRGFKFQRSLMPGGSCEATVFDAFGYTTGAVCVPLGNYHNMDKKRRKIAAEYIDIHDLNCMVKLFVELVNRSGDFKLGHLALKRRLRKLFARESGKLGPSHTRK